MSEAAIYSGLFVSALLAATILPMQSEALLVGLLLTDRPPVALLAVASIGNVLGSLINWWLGRQVARFRDRPWFPVTPDKLAQASGWYHRYGRWSLLLSWAPVVGDPLTVVAGILREPFWSFFILVTVAKVGRYVVLALLTLNLT